MNHQENQQRLDQQLKFFNGTENHFKHLSGFLYTDGVQFLASQFATYWLIDEILFMNCTTPLGEFQVWKLKRKGTSDVFTLSCEDGDDNEIFSKEIPFSDFTANSVELWFENNVLYLPSEH